MGQFDTGKNETITNAFTFWRWNVLADVGIFERAPVVKPFPGVASGAVHFNAVT